MNDSMNDTGKLRYNHNTGDYIAILGANILIVDADRLNYCLHYDDELDKPTYQVATWLPLIDGDTVQLKTKQCP